MLLFAEWQAAFRNLENGREWVHPLLWDLFPKFHNSKHKPVHMPGHDLFSFLILLDLTIVDFSNWASCFISLRRIWQQLLSIPPPIFIFLDIETQNKKLKDEGQQINAYIYEYQFIKLPFPTQLPWCAYTCCRKWT